MIGCLFMSQEFSLMLAQRTMILSLSVATVCQGCTTKEEPQCWPEENQYYVEALSKRLSKNGVAHSFNAEGGVSYKGEASVCFAPRFEPDVKKATREVDNYFREVVGVLRGIR